MPFAKVQQVPQSPGFCSIAIAVPEVKLNESENRNRNNIPKEIMRFIVSSEVLSGQTPASGYRRSMRVRPSPLNVGFPALIRLRSGGLQEVLDLDPNHSTEYDVGNLKFTVDHDVERIARYIQTKDEFSILIAHHPAVDVVIL